jgi:large subunit ribosomal protein L23
VSVTTIKDPRDVVLAPVVSEKSYGLIDEGKYTFLVDPRSNKTEIKLAVEKIFSVKVDSINTINRAGKRKRTKFGWGSARAPSVQLSPSKKAQSTSSAVRSRSGDHFNEEINYGNP